MKITPAQRKFLLSYIPDIMYEDGITPDMPRSAFVEKVSKLSFDGPATRGDCLVAKNLQESGIFADLVIHIEGAGQPAIGLKFTAVGADVLYDIHAKYG